MVQEKKPTNLMSIEHILCTPYDNNSYTQNHGLPSPVSTCYSSEEEYDDTSSSSSLSSIEQSPIQHSSMYNEDRISMYQQHRRAILPYRRRRRNNLNVDSDQTNGGGQKRMPWLPEEDILLKQGYEQGLSWAMIASTYLPHRSRGCCWGRFKTLKNKKFLNVRRQIRVQAKPWKTLNPTDMQAYL